MYLEPAGITFKVNKTTYAVILGIEWPPSQTFSKETFLTSLFWDSSQNSKERKIIQFGDTNITFFLRSQMIHQCCC